MNYGIIKQRNQNYEEIVCNALYQDYLRKIVKKGETLNIWNILELVEVKNKLSME